MLHSKHIQKCVSWGTVRTSSCLQPSARAARYPARSNVACLVGECDTAAARPPFVSTACMPCSSMAACATLLKGWLRLMRASKRVMKLASFWRSRSRVMGRFSCKSQPCVRQHQYQTVSQALQLTKHSRQREAESAWI